MKEKYNGNKEQEIKDITIPVVIGLLLAVGGLISGLWLIKTSIGKFQTEGKYQNNIVVLELSEKVDQLEASLSAALRTMQPGDSNNGIEYRLSRLESQYTGVSESLLDDGDKVITAKLLREKQVSLEKDIQELNEDINQVNSRYDSLLSTVFTVPLVGFIIAISTSLVMYVWNRIQRAKSQ